jgi:hypothetical protein
MGTNLSEKLILTDCWSLIKNLIQLNGRNKSGTVWQCQIKLEAVTEPD